MSDQFKVPENIKEADAMTPAKIEFLRLIKEMTNDEPNAMTFLRQAMDYSELSKRIDQGKAFNRRACGNNARAVCHEWMINPTVLYLTSTGHCIIH
jgi:hypothetical protein